MISSMKEVVEDKGKFDCAKHSITLYSHWKLKLFSCTDKKKSLGTVGFCDRLVYWSR